MTLRAERALHYRAIMSVKQALSEAIEALPESTTLEEAFERLYRAFRLKQAASGAEPERPLVTGGKGVLIPEEILRASHLDRGELLTEIAVLLYQKERLTLGQASQVAGLPQAQFQLLLASRRIPPHYDVEELHEDLATLRELGRL